MLMVVSPAKSLDFSRPLPAHAPSQPRFLAHSAQLIERLRDFSPQALAALMGISDALAALNVARFAEWAQPFTPENARAAVFAFDGDVYEGLDAASLTPAALARAQQQLRILSGLYGVLRPLDLMQAYRLEMGTKLANAAGKDLYAFWGDEIARALADDLAASPGAPVLVNLASEEYFKSVRLKALGARVLTPVFEERKGAGYKIVSFHAKRARGLMSRYVLEQGIDQPEALQDFAVEGYAFAPQASSAERWVFRREAA